MSTSCSRRTCTSIMPAASPRATAPARSSRASPRAIRRAHGGVGGCDASARAQPRQLPAGELRAAGRGRRPRSGAGRRRRSCRASASCEPAATRCTTRSSMIESGGRTAVFAADLIPTTAHVDEPWIMGYDLYPMDTLAFKRAFVREAIDREYLIFFEHDPEVAAGYIRRRERPQARRARRLKYHARRRVCSTNVQFQQSHMITHRHHRRQRPVRHGGADRPRRADASTRRSASRRRRT